MTTMMLAAAAIAVVTIALTHASPAQPVHVVTRASEPHRSNEHAARLLAGRYARGEITVEEYRRMMLVLTS